MKVTETVSLVLYNKGDDTLQIVGMAVDEKYAKDLISMFEREIKNDLFIINNVIRVREVEEVKEVPFPPMARKHTPLEVLLKQAREVVDRMSPEEKAAMLKQQAEGWAKAEAQWAKDFREGKCERD